MKTLTLINFKSAFLCREFMLKNDYRCAKFGKCTFHRQTCKCLFSQNEYLILLRKIHHRCLGTNITLDSLIIKNNFNNLYKKQIMRHFSEGDHRGKKNCPTLYDSLYVMFITFTGLVY